MAQGRIKHRLSRFTSKTSTNDNQNININFVNESKILPAGEINHVIDVNEQFNIERNKSHKYRVISTITPLMSNPLFNTKGDSGPKKFSDPIGFDLYGSFGFETFNNPLFKEDFRNSITTNPSGTSSVGRDDFSYEESLKLNLKEVNGWFGFYDPDKTKVGNCQFYDLQPSRYQFEFNNNQPKNWDITITYPDKKDEFHHLVYDKNNLKNGLYVSTATERELGGISLVTLGTAVPHNLTNGDIVRLKNMPDDILNGDFEVMTTGLDNGDDDDLFFTINVKSNEPALVNKLGQFFTGGRMSRLYYDREVKYYLRLFKRINSAETNLPLELDDYEIYPVGFSKTIYNDTVYQLTFNEDINVEGILDYMNRPLTELYITFVKSKKDRFGDSVFTQVLDGFDLKNIEGNVKTSNDRDKSVSNIRKMHTLGNVPEPFPSHYPLDVNGVDINDNYYYGDIVEFSEYEVKETILSVVMHRFNTFNRENGSDINIFDNSPRATLKNKTIEGLRNEGYIYQPHYRMQIRNLSDYVEQGDLSVDEIPEYAVPLGDGRYLWRDILDIGLDDGSDNYVEYPFLNNAHYIHKNICISLKRQDPFGNFDLYYSGNDKIGSPKDTLGDVISNFYTINNGNGIC